MRERSIEKKLAEKMRQSGGIAIKFTSPSFSGLPDRLLLAPGGRMAFAEIKAPGKTPRSLQASRHRMLRELGFRVYVIDTLEAIDEVIKDLLEGEPSGGGRSVYGI